MYNVSNNLQFSSITNNYYVFALQDRVEYKKFVKDMEGADFAPVSVLEYF